MKLAPLLLITVAAALGLAVFGYLSHKDDFNMIDNFPTLDPTEIGEEQAPTSTELATFGSGCFWCSEAVFQQLKGVIKVEPGYSGGTIKDPTYRQVCTGQTGHAEVVQITFDPTLISYPELLEVFWRSHDPTTKDRQGNDTGPQYRSVIFTHNQRQQELAERYKRKIDAAGVFTRPLVTEIVPFATFYPAEAEHGNYFAENPNAGYCRVVIAPKVEKLRHVFRSKLKAP